MSQYPADADFRIKPREVADKSSRETLSKAIRMALAVESEPVRRNTNTFNQNRYTAVRTIDDYEALKDRARAIKEKAIEQIESSVAVLRKVIEERGGHFYLAKDGADANAYILEVCQKHQAKLAVKSKSMTSEEIRLNGVLEGAGIEVAETDLAEFILQVADEQPSHIVAPAIHRSRERISKLFKDVFHPEQPLETGEDLTKFAREILRRKFLTADVGISGANIIDAETGTIVLVENEGNIRMVTQAPPVHIAVAGVEKIVPHWEDLAPFIELLAPSGTGQPLSQYTNILHPPLKMPSFSFDGRPRRERAFYLVLVDNGRLRMRHDTELKRALYCMRCSACLNVCPVFQVLGGHAFGGETYSGGIGGAWEAGTGSLEKARFSELCTGCSRCVRQCPVRIDIPWLNTVLHDRLNQLDGKGAAAEFFGKLFGSESRDREAGVEKQFFGNYATFAKAGSAFAPLSNGISALSPVRHLMEKMVGLDHRRRLPAFQKNTFTKKFAAWQKGREKSSGGKARPAKVLLFADIYTNFLHPESGMAAVKVLDALGIDVRLSDVPAEGRAALSQGMVETAARRANRVAHDLENEIDRGWKIVVPEPSVLALFRRDYKNLLNNNTLFEKLRENSLGAVEYLGHYLTENKIPLQAIFDANRFPPGKRLFYHGHCQRKSLGGIPDEGALFTELGFDVVSSKVECCGMAGSFGYKKEFYDVSMKIGEALFQQIRLADGENPRTIVTGGISCRHQIEEGVHRPVFHPMEVLEKILAAEGGGLS